MPVTYAMANNSLSSLKKKDLKSSGLLVTVEYLDGTKAVETFLAVNGLSDATLDALQEDVRRSWEYKIELRPPKSN